MPRMNDPIQPKICACPCACSHACGIDPGPCDSEMLRRFQTPRKVPGNSMNTRPLAINAVTIRWLCRSLAMRASSAEALREGAAVMVVSTYLLLHRHDSTACDRDHPPSLPELELLVT